MPPTLQGALSVVGGAGPAAESEGAGLGVLEGGQAGGSDRQPCRQEFTEPGAGATLPLSLCPCAKNRSLLAYLPAAPATSFAKGASSAFWLCPTCADRQASSSHGGRHAHALGPAPGHL